MEKEDHLWVLCWNTDGKFIPGCSMTVDETAIAVSRLTSTYPIRMPEGREKEKIASALVYLQVFKYVTDIYGLSEYCPPKFCDFCLNCYVVAKAQLNDGRWVRIAITWQTCFDLFDPGNNSGVVTVNYRSTVDLGNDVCFVSFFLDAEDTMILEGRKKFCRHLKN